MTFDEWWKANAYTFPQADYSADCIEEVARAAWNAARPEGMLTSLRSTHRERVEAELAVENDLRSGKVLHPAESESWFRFLNADAVYKQSLAAALSDEHPPQSSRT